MSLEMSSSGWHVRIWPSVAIIEYGSGAFETARVERQNLLRVLYAEVRPSINLGLKGVPKCNVVFIEGERVLQYPIEYEAVIKNVIDVLSVDWKPAAKARFAQLLKAKPIFDNWAPSPGRGRKIARKLPW